MPLDLAVGTKAAGALTAGKHGTDHGREDGSAFLRLAGLADELVQLPNHITLLVGYTNSRVP